MKVKEVDVDINKVESLVSIYWTLNSWSTGYPIEVNFLQISQLTVILV